MNKEMELENVSSLSKRKTVLSIMIIALLFFIFGFTTWINAILIPYFKISCELIMFNLYLWLLPFTLPIL